MVLILRSDHGHWGIKIDRGVVVVTDVPLNEDDAMPAGPEGAVVIGSITRSGASHWAIDAEATWRNARGQDRTLVQGRPRPGRGQGT